MTTHNGGSGNPLDRDIEVTRETHKTADTDIENTQDFHPENPDHFEDLQHDNPMKVTALTREVDDFMSMSSGWGSSANRNFEMHRT